jgi:PKD domain/Arylsulfotransferase (ASST)
MVAVSAALASLLVVGGIALQPAEALASPASTAAPSRASWPGPIANVQANPSSGGAPLLVDFNASQSYGNGGTIQSWSLNFGDGTPEATGTNEAPGAVITHTYSSVGTYTAVLTTENRSMASSTSTATVTVSAPSSTGGANDEVVVPVTGTTALTSIASNPIALTPKFTAADTDYVWYCVDGTNHLNLVLRSHSSITADGQTGTALTIPVTVTNNQAVVVEGPNETDYWIRCLPSTFPHLDVTRSGDAEPGYYLTGTFKDGPKGIPGYAMILNSYGTPVWYLTNMPESGDNVELLPGTHTVAWSNRGPYSLYDLDNQSVSWLAPPVDPPDEHELYTDTSGNHWMISVPVKTGYNLKSIGFGSYHNIVDCVVQETNSSGTPVWKWDAADYISPLETDHLAYKMTDQGVPAIDVYHCNSVDVDPENPNYILISMREVGVFLVDKATNAILWKLGGTSVAPMDKEHVLKIEGDPEGAIQGQHDARFQPNGDISMFDDHTGLTGAARAVEYSISAQSDSATPSYTATMDWEFVAPSGDHTSRMGSVRRYDVTGQTYDQLGSSYQGPTETLIDWGQGIPDAGFTVVGNSGNQLLNLTFEKGYVGNRGVFVPSSALDLTQLRDSAGTAFP